MQTWHNNKLIEGKPVIDSLNWTLHYSGSVWEGIRCYHVKGASKGHLFKLGEHIDRLFESARIMKMEISYTWNELVDACKTVALANGARKHDLYIRPIVYYSQDAEGIKSSSKKVTVDIFAIPIKNTYNKDGIKVITASRHRSYPTYEMQCKSSNNYGEAKLWMSEIERSGVDDILFKDEHGYYTEASVANLFIIKDGKMITPPNDGSILAGITRKTILESQVGAYSFLKPKIKRITRPDLILAEEVFMTGTYAEVIPILEIDGYKIGPNKGWVKTLQTTYQNIIDEKENEFNV